MIDIMSKGFVLIATLTMLISCRQSQMIRIYPEFERDLIPEGIAIDEAHQQIFINSLKKNKIVSCAMEGDKARNFIGSGQHGYLSGFGMTVMGDTLFALGNVLQRHNNKSVLLLLNTSTGDLIRSYELDDTSFIYLNDLAVSEHHHVYITDSESNRIFTVNPVKGGIEVYFEDDEILHPNGIAISDDALFLYVATWRKGIRILDLSKKRIINQAHTESAGIDGLKYYKGSLYGIVNARRDSESNGLYRFELDQTLTEIVSSHKLIEFGSGFSIPTTLDIYRDQIYFVTNSQLDNFNQETNEIIDTSILSPYEIMRYSIKTDR